MELLTQRDAVVWQAGARTHARAIAWSLAVPALLVITNILFRLPALLNAGGVHSDAAIVGLQARHFLDGEWAPFLWGAGYQGVVDVVLIAGAFALFGSSPLVLMAVPLALHIVANLLAWDVLRRRVPTASAALLSLILVFTPQAINGVALYAPRQAAITLVFAAIWFFDRASASPRRSLLLLSLGVWCSGVALYADLFTLQVIAPMGLFVALCWFDARPGIGRFVSRAAVTLANAAGVTFLLWLIRRQAVGSTPTGMSLDRVSTNLPLLRDALGWVLGYGVYVPGKALLPVPWTPAPAFEAFQKVAVVLFAVLMASALVLFFSRRIPWEVRRLGVLGIGCAVATVAGYLVSTMPSNIGSVRYLAPIVWMAPFALAPVAHLLLPRGLTLLLTPYLITAAVGGWLSFGPYVDGIMPTLDPRGQAKQERRVGEFLWNKGVRAATAQFWLAYRLSFLWREEPFVVPLYGDRYPPHRKLFDAASPYALVFHPSEPRAKPGPYEAQLKASRKSYSKHVVEGFTVLIVTR